MGGAAALASLIWALQVRLEYPQPTAQGPICEPIWMTTRLDHEWPAKQKWLVDETLDISCRCISCRMICAW